MVTEQMALPSAYRLPQGTERGPFAQQAPRCVFIEVTNHCNLSCATCPHTFFQQERRAQMSLATFQEVVAHFPLLERAVLHGIGEPLLNAHLPEMIRMLKDRGITVLFNSNGTLLDDAWQEALVVSGLDEYRLSLDAAESQMYLRMRGKPLFETVVRNAMGLVATKRRLGRDKPRVSLWCIGMKDNIDQVPALVRLAGQMGIPEVYVQRLTFVVDPTERHGLAHPRQALFGHTSREEDALIGEAERLSRGMGIAFQAAGATDPRNSLSGARDAGWHPWTACLRPWTSAYITANGNALPCCISPFATAQYEALIMGNIWQERFAQIWNGSRYRAWRRALLSDNPPQPCSGCGVCWSL